jgi:hypothetical protein
MFVFSKGDIYAKGQTLVRKGELLEAEPAGAAHVTTKPLGLVLAIGEDVEYALTIRQATALYNHHSERDVSTRKMHRWLKGGKFRTTARHGAGRGGAWYVSSEEVMERAMADAVLRKVAAEFA